jgi:RNA polymerase sigma-70 factor (ECF subfamily)
MVAPSARPERAGAAAVDLDACRRGDRAALDALLRAELPALERLLARLVGPSGDLEDLLQTTLIAAVEGLPRFRGEASIRTWLARIAVHSVHAWLRQTERRRPRVALELLTSEPADQGPSPERALGDKRAVARLYEHLDALEPRKRIAFVLHVVEGRPIDEVAALMAASGPATKSRVFFGRRALMARVRRDPALRELIASYVVPGREP